MKRLGLLLLCALHLTAIHAAEPIGRLFFTPAQRATLDAGKELEKPKGAARVVHGPSSVQVNGVVQRSDGESMVWINGKPVGKGSSVAASVSNSDPAAVRVRIRGNDQAADLRVGQTLDTASGKIDKIAPANSNGAARKRSRAPEKSAGENAGDAKAAENATEEPK